MASVHVRKSAWLDSWMLEEILILNRDKQEQSTKQERRRLPAKNDSVILQYYLYKAVLLLRDFAKYCEGDPK